MIDLDEWLAEVLLVYMILTVFILILYMLIISNGKTDRRRLRHIGQSSYGSFFTDSKKIEIVKPTNEIEHDLLQIWAEVLNIPLQAISTDVTFTRLGGDSITAMQVISRCRRRNILISLSSFLRSQTIRKIALVSSRNVPRSISPGHELKGTTWSPSPIQQLFFDANPKGLHHFNQGFLLNIRRAVSGDDIRLALQGVVARHSMLRARFRQSEAGTWQQYICDDHPNVFGYYEHHLATKADIEDIMDLRQGTINICDGPLFTADLFIISGGKQYLYLLAHHLVVDLVSWRILWYDLEHAISVGHVPSSPILSFRKWCEMQRSDSQSLEISKILPFEVHKPDLEYWGISKKNNTQNGCQELNRTIDENTTSSLLGRANHAFQSEVTDILVGTLMYTFNQVFADRELPAVFLEGHGREGLNDLIHEDLSDTVGWFTTIHPIQFVKKRLGTIPEAVKDAKGLRRSVPGKGRPYFAYRYNNMFGWERFKDHCLPEVTFNFTGVYQQLETVGGLFAIDTESVASARSLRMSPTAQRLSLIEVVAGVSKGRMIISFGIHQKMKHQNRLKLWVNMFTEALQLVAIDLAKTPAQLTRSDFPLLHRTHDSLDVSVNKAVSQAGLTVEEVEGIYPCTPLQEGVLLSLHKETASYANYFVWECELGEAGEFVSPNTLRAAWERVVAHHSILSTIFLELLSEGIFLQVMLRQVTPRISIVHIQDENPSEYLVKQDRPEYSSKEPNHTLTICQASDGRVALRLDISHALIDAASISILMSDLSQAYVGDDLKEAAPFCDYVKYRAANSQARDIRFWFDYLATVQRCEFPTGHSREVSPARSKQRMRIPKDVTEGLFEFCQKLEITRATFVQVVWALVLSHFCASRDVVFGYMVSNRDAQINGVENMAGPLINIVPSRINLDDTRDRVLLSTYKKMSKQLEFQHVSLAEIQKEMNLGMQPLFNTAITVRESRQMERPERKRIWMKEIENEDPDEVSIQLLMITKANILKKSSI